MVQYIFNANHVPLVFEKHIHRNINISGLFRLNYTKCPFRQSSKLDHTTCPDLFLVTEARRYERTSFSLLKDRSQLAIYTGIIHKAIRRMSGLQDAIILSFMTWN